MRGFPKVLGHKFKMALPRNIGQNLILTFWNPSKKHVTKTVSITSSSKKADNFNSLNAISTKFWLVMQINNSENFDWKNLKYFDDVSNFWRISNFTDRKWRHSKFSKIFWQIFQNCYYTLPVKVWCWLHWENWNYRPFSMMTLLRPTVWRKFLADFITSKSVIGRYFEIGLY